VSILNDISESMEPFMQVGEAAEYVPQLGSAVVQAFESGANGAAGADEREAGEGFGITRAIDANGWASQAAGGAANAMSVLSVVNGVGEFAKGDVLEGGLDISSGGVGLAAAASEDTFAAALGPVGAALGLEAAGAKYTEEHGWWGQEHDENGDVVIDPETGKPKNRSGSEMIADDVSEAYENAGGGVGGALSAGATAVGDTLEVLGGDLVGGVLSIGEGIGNAVSSIFHW
jgi:hypothetical protein